MKNKRYIRLLGTILTVVGGSLTLMAILNPEFWEGGDTWVFPIGLMVGLLVLHTNRPGRTRNEKN